LYLFIFDVYAQVTGLGTPKIQILLRLSTL